MRNLRNFAPLLFALATVARADLASHSDEDAFALEVAKLLPTPRFPRAAPAQPADSTQAGQWSSVIPWTPHIPVSAANLPDGRILTFASNQRTSFPVGPEFTYAATWDPATGAFQEINHSSHDMFCGGLVQLADGRVMVAGGRNNTVRNSVFDWRTNTWTRLPDMNGGRWYNTAVALGDGQVFTVTGSGTGQNSAERWTGSAWTLLPGINWTSVISETGYATNWHPFLNLAPDGRLAHFGPSDTMHWLTTTGTGGMVNTGTTVPGTHYPKEGCWTMFDEGRLLVAGGGATTTSNVNDGSTGTSTTTAYTVDIRSNPPVVASTAAMANPRQFANCVVLPSGEVLVMGGNTSGWKFNDTGSVFPCELWNPRTGTWRTVASISVPRNYHSVALLLPDGRVLLGGGGLGGGNHQDAQVYTPPSLFTAGGALATRPVLNSAPASISAGSTFTVNASSSIVQFAFIKMSSITHSVNTDLRRLVLPYTEPTAGSYQITAHSSLNVMTPGYWMLFGLNASGAYSTSKVILVENSPAPALSEVRPQTSALNVPASLQLSATLHAGTPAYNATGLPPGLTINTATGLISGTPSAAGNYTVNASVSVGGQTSTAVFAWSVISGNAGVLRHDWWLNVPGVALTDLFINPAWPHSPTGSDTLTSFEAPVDVADNLGRRIRGWIKPAVTGQYRFWIASDDEGQLLLSPNASSGGATVIARVPQWSGSREWTKFPEQQSALISLTAGQAYYIEAIMKEGGGGDNLAVAWQPPGATGQTVIPGSFLTLSPQPPNQPPSLTNPGAQASVRGTAVNLQLAASDPENATLTWSASGLPAGLTMNATGRITGTPTAAGTYNPSVSVSDGVNAAVSSTFTWTVVAPVSLSVAGNAAVPAGSSTNVTATSSGGLNPQFRWSWGDGTADSAPASSPSASHTWATPGRYRVVVTVTDSSGATLSAQYYQAVHAPLTAAAPARSSSIVFEDRATGNDRVWSVNPDNDSVSVFDAVTRTRLAEIATGLQPHSVAIAPDGRIWVVNSTPSTISIISPSTLAVVSTVNLPRAAKPWGLAFDPDGSDAWVACEASGQLLRLNPTSGAQVAALNLGLHIRHVAVNAASSRVFVSRFITPLAAGEGTATIDTTNAGGEVIAVNPATLTVERTIRLQHSNVQDSSAGGRGLPNYLGAPAISPDGLSAWIASKQDNIKRGALRDGNQLTHDLAVRSISSRLDLSAATPAVDDLAGRVDHDNAGVASATAWDARGIYVFTALEGSRTVAVVDAWNRRELLRFDAGRAPQGLTVSPDGRTLYVQNFMDRSVTVHDITATVNGLENPPSLTATMSSVAAEKLSATVLLGKKHFYDSRDARVANQEYISCAACHNDGGDDGRVWDFTGIGEGLRNTISLRGKAGTGHGPLHWTGNFDEVQDFENQIRTFAGGTGLSSVVHPPMGSPNSGTSADLDALAAYVASLNTEAPSPARNSDGTLTAAAQAGLAVFRANACAQCHSGDAYTNSALNVFRNVGTLKPSSGQRLGQPLTGLDVPSLRGLWQSPPYLHDGSAATLSAAITAHQGLALSPTDLSNLSAYLQQLDGAAPPAGLAPTVVLSGPASTSGAFTVSADFSAAVSGVTGADFLVGNGSLTGLTQVNATTWTLTVTPTAPGTVTVRTVLNAAQSAEGNASLPSNILAVTYTGPSVPAANEWWKLDDTTGTTAANAASARNGTHQGGVLINQPGARSATAGAARYDGVDDQTSLPALNNTSTSMTLAMWVRRDGLQKEVAQLFFANSAQTNAGIGFSNLGNHGLRYHWAWTHWAFTPSPELIVPDNQWCLVALVIQPDRGTLYLRTTAGLQSAVNIAPHDLQSFEAASALAVDSARTNRRFKGWLDDVRFWYNALPSSDIEALYQSATIGSGNRPPVVTQPANQTSNRGSIVTLAVAGTDPDGDTLTWSATGLPAGLSIGSSTGIISGTISASAAAANNVTVTAADASLSASTSFTWATTAPGTTVPNADDHWRLDETTGALAINSIRTLNGAHQNGVLINQPGVTSSTGRSAFYDGVDDITRVSPPGAAGTDFTVAVWVRRNGAQRDFAGIVSCAGTTDDFSFGVGYDDELRYRWNSGQWAYAPSPALTLPDNQWALAALSVDADGATLYLRTAAGLSSARNNSPHPAVPFSSDFIIGADGSRTGRNFKGNLDEVKLFRSSLSSADIEALWLQAQSGSSNRAPVVSRPADQSTPRASTASLQIQASDPDGNAITYAAAGLPAGLSINSATGFISGTVLSSASAIYSVTVTVSDGGLSAATSFTWNITAAAGLTPPDDWWKLDEATGTTAANSVRTLDGTHLGGAVPGQPGASAATGSSVYFDGTDDATAIPALSNTGLEFSMLLWVKRDGALRNAAQFLFCRDGETDAGLGVGSANNLRYHWDGGYWDFAPSPDMTLPDNTWCLAALVVRPDSGTLLLRTPSGLQSSTNFAPHTLQPFNSVSNLAADPSRTGRNFKGWLDDVRLYRKALTLDEVEAVWLTATGGQRSNGLTGTYFNGTGFETQIMQRLDPTLNYNWSLASPAAGVNADNFSARWTGCLIPQFTQTHTFHLLAATGCRMWVNDVQIINNWTSPVSTEVTGIAALTAGVPVPIRVEYYHTTGNARCELSWSASGLTKQIIPQSRLLINETSLGGLGLVTATEPDKWTPSASTMLAIDDLPWVQQSMGLIPADNGKLTLDFIRRSGITEQWKLERSSDLRSWFAVPGDSLQILDLEDGTEQVRLPGAEDGFSDPAGKTFYRVRAGR